MQGLVSIGKLTLAQYMKSQLKSRFRLADYAAQALN